MLMFLQLRDKKLSTPPSDYLGKIRSFTSHVSLTSGRFELANVSDSLDALHFHLWENPILCSIHRTLLI